MRPSVFKSPIYVTQGHVSGDAIENQIQDTEIQKVYAYWSSLRSGAKLPARSALDPLETPRAMRYSSYVSVFRDPWSFRYRLIGTGLTEALGYDATGMDLRDVYSDFESTANFSLRKQVAETRQPIWRQGTSTVKFRLDFVPIEQVYLPLAEDGETVDTIWGVLNYKMGCDQDAS